MSQQHFVGAVAFALGFLSLVGAWSNADWLFQLRKMQTLEQYWGRTAARLWCGLIGCGLIALGLCIAAGWLPRRTTSHSWQSSPTLVPGTVLAC